MSKGYVMVDIPDSCIECNFCIYDELRNGYYCSGQSDEEGTEFFAWLNSKPSWCPIKEFPEGYDNPNRYEPDDAKFAEGYNDCLNNILGDENK